MQIKGKQVLVLGGAGMVGRAVCRSVLAHKPANLFIAARRESTVRRAAAALAGDFGDQASAIIPLWGDVFVRAEWRSSDEDTRTRIFENPEKRQRLIADVIDPLDEDIVSSSLLVKFILGEVDSSDRQSMDIVIDCMNTATALSYQDIYSAARKLNNVIKRKSSADVQGLAVDAVLSSLYVPQLVRHVQLLYEGLRRGRTAAYIKVGTSGTGGMGFDIPFTHGEEKPSRLLLAKAAMAGAQSMLNFLLARTGDGPAIVKEIKPTAMIGWRSIGYGPIIRRGREHRLFDCPLANAVSFQDAKNVVTRGEFGVDTGHILHGVYIDTGENGMFSASEFEAITAPGLMRMVTPEEIADDVVRELVGAPTGHDIVAALDGAVMGPSYRAGYLRQAALARLRQLETRHGESVAFEILGPPRLSKLLFEACLLKRAFGDIAAIGTASPQALSAELEDIISQDKALRCHIISIGLPILLADGERFLRGPMIKSTAADKGWVDLSPDNMHRWQQRLVLIDKDIAQQHHTDTSSRDEQAFTSMAEANASANFPNIGEIVAWILQREDMNSGDSNDKQS